MGIRGRLLIIVLATALPFPAVALIVAPNNRFAVGSASLVAVVIGSMVAIFFARRFDDRLRRLNRAAQSISDGEFGTPIVDVRASSGDQIAELEMEFNRMGDSLIERRNRYSELDTLKSDFVSSVSHELRTPLTTIKALTRLLMRGNLSDEKSNEYLETISVECDRQIDLVLNLLDLSRIEGGVFRLSLEKVNATEVIRSCVRSEASAAERRQHRLEIVTFDEVPPICADPKALRRVLSNVIENAIKYTPDGGLITLSAQIDGGYVAMKVTDNGRGIPAEDLPVLFDKFHRGRPAPRSATTITSEYSEFLEDADVSGVGLGLYLGKNVVERMGGSIAVETEVGKGSTFMLKLPVWKPADGEVGDALGGMHGKTAFGG